MKTLFRYVLLLLVLGYSAEANAQKLTFVATDMVRIDANSKRWKYNYVKCGGVDKVTSITISMINNHIVDKPTANIDYKEFPSLGNDPKVHAYTFGGGITTIQVEQFIKSITFEQNNSISAKKPYIHIYVDANPTYLPIQGSTITVWPDHPDKTTHYYMWVQGYVPYLTAYNKAKEFYFQGMRGYLPTITSEEEHALLINISREGGWSAGARSNGHVFDAKMTDKIEPILDDEESTKFKWQCGPEAGFEYFKGPSHNSPTAGGILNKAYSPWVSEEPNNGSNEAAIDTRNAEWCMQINFESNTRGRGWNDLPVDPNRYIGGYFIEFGGTDVPYTIKIDGVEYATYDMEARKKYKKPTSKRDINDDHWPGYDPGATSFADAEVKERAMRSHVMVIQ